MLTGKATKSAVKRINQNQLIHTCFLYAHYTIKKAIVTTLSFFTELQQ